MRGALHIVTDGSMPLRSWIVAAGLLALVLELWLTLIALKRRAQLRTLRAAAEHGGWDDVEGARVPGRILEVAALAALLLIPLATAASVAEARGRIKASFAASDAGTHARLYAEGARGQLGAISLGIVLSELTGGIAIIAWGAAFAARRQIGGLVHAARIATMDPRGAAAWTRHPGAEPETVMACAGSVAAMAFLPALQGGLSFCSLLAQRLGPLAELAPPERTRQLDVLLHEARRALDAGTSAGQLGMALSILTCAGFLWWKSPARARRQWLGRAERSASARPAPRGVAAWGTVVCVVVAATLYLVSRPLQAENRTPWPPGEATGDRLAIRVATPDLAGPDRLPRAPLLEVTPGSAWLDGRELPEEALPARPPGGGGDEIVVACDQYAPARRLAPLLSSARAGGFHRAAFAFVQRESVQRPVLGTFTREHVTAAVARLDAGDAGAAVLRAEDFGICAELAARIVELRRQGRLVAVR